MLSVVSICTDEQKTEDFSRKLLKPNGEIWWGLHIWQSKYKPSGFIDSARETSDSYQHWLDVLSENDLTVFIDDDLVN